jgi:predicted DNA-binding ribbon-helix-helix protein
MSTIPNAMLRCLSLPYAKHRLRDQDDGILYIRRPVRDYRGNSHGGMRVTTSAITDSQLRVSLGLEVEEYAALIEIAAVQRCTVNDLIHEVETTHPRNLGDALRLVAERVIKVAVV